MVEALAPWEGKELLELAQLGSRTKKYQVAVAQVNNEIVHNLRQIYDAYIANNMSFMEQVRLIAPLP